jgi:predicted DNA-binding protein
MCNRYVDLVIAFASFYLIRVDTMSLLSIRLTDQLLSEVRIRSKALHMSQAKYIRTAIEHMNEEVLRCESQQRLKRASLRIRKESQLINAEFSRIEHDPKA